MIDLMRETPIPLAAACPLFPPRRNANRTHLSTLLRWVTPGAKGPGGERVKLEAVRLGGRWMTSRAAIQRFADRLTPQSDYAAQPSPRTPGKRRRASERVDQELDKMG